MKVKRRAIIIIVIIVILLAVSIGTYLLLTDDNKLSVEEKEWLAANTNNVQNVYVLNNIDVFGKNGSGIIFDYINSFKEEYNIDINNITYNYGENVNSRSFKLVDKVEKNQVLLYTEHYVLISKEKKSLNSLNKIGNNAVGVVVNDVDKFNNYLKGMNVNIVSYESSTKLFEAIEASEEIVYAIVPLEENLSSILTSNYVIDYHISDFNKYLVFEKQDNDMFSSIISKYYTKFKEEELNKSIDRNELNTFLTALSITDKDLKELQAKEYKYGFINNNPYEVLTSGTYGGIVAEYLSRFSRFSNVEFSFTRYKSLKKFKDELKNKSFDLYYNYYDIETDYQKIDSLDYIYYVVVAPFNNDLVINSIGALGDTPIYVFKDSILEKYLESLGGLKVKNYESLADLKKIASKDYVIAMDKLSYNYYDKQIISNYNIRYENELDSTYNFYVNSNNELFKLLFSKYINILDPKEIQVNGLYNHSVTIESGTLIGKIARYSLIIIAVGILLFYLVYKSTKKVKIAKRIKKVDKIKYIDQLTSLKNRNYLSDSLPGWNKNTIYPQATIVIDLNKLQEINDNLGYENGDKQIKSAANIFIRTQLDNTDIIRTDGNEFLIYLVGYSEKQVVSYIRKLNKEFKKLPYEYGAAIGYSMVLNDSKTLEDAINESVEDMKTKKLEQENGES